MTFHILTIFPGMFQGFLNESILKKAQGKGLIEIKIHDIRTYSTDKHHKVDDTPYGGGAGMVMTPQPLFDAIEAVILRQAQDDKRAQDDKTKGLRKARTRMPVFYLSPRGKHLTQPFAERLVKKHDSFILICGHYEGIDQRVIDLCVDAEISIGDFVLSGGEVPAMVFIDVLSRLSPGVLGNKVSHEEETFSKKLDRKKEYPHYTRPPVFRDMKVPEILLNGHHAEIEKWRRERLW